MPVLMNAFREQALPLAALRASIGRCVDAFRLRLRIATAAVRGTPVERICIHDGTPCQQWQIPQNAAVSVDYRPFLNLFEKLLIHAESQIIKLFLKKYSL